MAFPGTYNFSYYRGDLLTLVVRPKNSNGSSFVLSGYSANFVIATQAGPTGTQYPCNTTINTTTNEITCTIPTSVGRTLSPGTYVYDVQINQGTTTVYTLLTGTVSVTDDIVGAV